MPRAFEYAATSGQRLFFTRGGILSKYGARLAQEGTIGRLSPLFYQFADSARMTGRSAFVAVISEAQEEWGHRASEFLIGTVACNNLFQGLLEGGEDLPHAWFWTMLPKRMSYVPWWFEAGY